MEEDKNDDFSIFMENDYDSVQRQDVDIIQEEHNNQETFPKSKEFPWFPSNFGSPQMGPTNITSNQYETLNKILPGINFFFTLEGVNNKRNADNSEMNHLDIESLANDNKDLNLNKFFEEDPQKGWKQNNQNSSMNTMFKSSPDHNLSNSQNMQREPEQEIKNEYRGQQSNRQPTSFFKNYLPTVLENEFDKTPWNLPFVEFLPSEVFNKNIENVTCLQNFNNDVQFLHEKAYKTVMEQLRRAASARPVTGKLLAQILCESFLQQMADFFNYVKRCDNDYTLNLIKNETNSTQISKLQTGNRMINEGGYNLGTNGNSFIKPGNTNEINQGLFNKLEYLGHSNSIMNGTIPQKMPETSNTNSIRENISILGSELDEIDTIPDGTKKKERKFWNETEQTEIEELCRKYHPSSVPTEKLEQFAKKYNRTLTSVQTKAQKVKGLIAKKEQELIMESMNKGSGLKIASATLSQAQNNMSNGLNNSSQRYEVSLEKMIKIALSSFPNKTATKDQILDKIGELYFSNQANISSLHGNETWRNSVSQLLSSKKIVKKIRGTFTLASRDLVNTNIAQATTLKSRLIYILSTQLRYVADFETIKQRFEEQFKNSLTYEQEKNWEKSVRKILTQSVEFDSSNSKTRYMLFSDVPTKLD